MYDRILIPVTTRSFSREIDPSFANQLKHLIQAHPNACFMLLYIFEPRDCRWLAAGLPNLDPDLTLSLAAHQLTRIERLLQSVGAHQIEHQLAVGNQYLVISQLIQKAVMSWSLHLGSQNGGNAAGGICPIPLVQLPMTF
ncbi:hypothetical protein BV56_1827 [Limosilactobacillus mucosae]|mgnify:FL=1|uniref:hypothetical protein n=1 Tax=Limosilactobacillus mucosae TaxID=97478 RepID=UPI000D6B35FC|nr:hypothetical protein [Limosilactobacillus mucosae]PWJ43593.1 hypothetical protein BV56_1827 [Limosilactobacillus mucosae]SUQ20720.1 hypothetical protein SAMN02744693_1827 [Limosilactobacillus mucosae]